MDTFSRTHIPPSGTQYTYKVRKQVSTYESVDSRRKAGEWEWTTRSLGREEKIWDNDREFASKKNAIIYTKLMYYFLKIARELLMTHGRRYTINLSKT